ncbi:MAG TPA: hypothetical protein VFC52_03670, partial [Solirubrobacterales bacterium]|nr:hypothetical protein [Solirubrobacterales bacterium]
PLNFPGLATEEAFHELTAQAAVDLKTIELVAARLLRQDQLRSGIGNPIAHTTAFPVSSGR